ncbi:MAG TPA: hypothetical protein VMH81_10685, partial [Bryobacteraceae bacterium]|nr:hypothetical protein [Bryobacteraceae bacterium]
LTVPLEKAPRQVREITSGKSLAPGGGARVQIRGEVPAQAVRVYRIDYVRPAPSQAIRTPGRSSSIKGE